MKNKTLLILLVFITSFSSAQTWTALISGTTDHCLSVSTPSPSICYVSGSNGTLLKTIDGGLTWTTLASGTTKSFYSICFTDNNTGYVAGDSKTILKTTNGGTTWLPVNLIPNSPEFHYRHIKFIDDNTGFASGGAYSIGGTVADSGVVYKTTDAGATWSQVLATGVYGAIYSTFFTSSQVGYAADYSGPVHKTTDGGLTWNATAAGDSLNPSNVYFVNENKGFLNCASDGKVKYTVDGGVTWNAYIDRTPEMVFGIDFYDINNGFSVGGNIANNTGTILQTSDGGTSWNPSVLSTPVSRLSQIDLNAAEGYVVGLNGTILKMNIPTTPSDTTYKCRHWSKLVSGTTNKLLSVTVPDPEISYVSGENGTILKTIDGGQIWIVQSSGTTEHINSIYFTDTLTGYAVGENKTALKTANGGTTWTPMTINLNTSTNYSFKHIQFLDATTGYASGSLMAGTPAVADSGFVYKTTDAGANWTLSLKTTNIYGGVNSTFFVSPLVGYASELQGPIYKTRDGGITWTSVNVGNTTSGAIYFTDSVNGIFTTNTGQIQKTKNTGISYSVMKDNISPNKLQGIDFYNDTIGFMVAGNASGTAGALLQTTNGGDNWFKLNIGIPLSGLTNIDVYDAGLGYMVGYDGLIIKYDTCPSNDTIFIPGIYENNVSNNRLNVFPNPIGTIATVDLSNSGLVGQLTIELIDVFGKVIKVETVFNSDKYIISRKDLPSGVYFIKAYDSTGHVAIGKFIAN